MKTKECKKCHIQKPLINYLNQKNSIDGTRHECKECANAKRRLYSKTKIGLISNIFSNQKQHSKRRGYNLPNYTKVEFLNWVLSREIFIELYNSWVDSNYDKLLVPSVDRINDYLPYTLKNIRVTTWEDNNDKGNLDVINGINNKNSKSVIQYSMDMTFLKEYYSLAQAERETGVDHSHISRVCLGKLRMAKGFIWKFKIKE